MALPDPWDWLLPAPAWPGTEEQGESSQQGHHPATGRNPVSTWTVVTDWCGPVQSPAEVLKKSLGSDQSVQIRTGKKADGNTEPGSGHGHGGEAGGVAESLPWGCASGKRQDQSGR